MTARRVPQPLSLPATGPSRTPRADAMSAARRRRPRATRRGVSAAALLAMVEDSEEGMILADTLGVIQYANRSAERFLGYRPAELIGRLGFDLCRGEHLPVAQEAFSRCLAHPGEPVTLNVDVRHPAGGFRSLAVTLVNRLPAPGVKAIVVHFRDTAEQADRESFRALFEQAPIGLGVADRQGNLLAFNEAILQPGAYLREDILRLGNVALLYARPTDRERVLAIAREHGFVWREEVPFRRKDGSTYDTLLSLMPVRFQGRECWYATVEDVSDRTAAEAQRLELEAQLRQAQKMEAVGRMTGGIAHDFNNLLSVIMANAELIGSALAPDAKDARDDLEELRSAAQRGAAMIRKLLGFSRRADLNTTPTDLADLVNRMRGMLRHVIPEHITLDVDVAEQCVAQCDAGAVEQMVLNLATNARDAMPHGGTVRLAVSSAVVDRETPVRPSWLTPGEFVRLSVADTGVGMDQATRARALEPFFTTKPPGVGTGLGLSMVYGLVKQQHGYIDLVSEPGKGTTVHLYFPRATGGPAERPPTSAPLGAQRGAANILLLEDDEGLQRVGKRVLERLGYRVLVASDGVEGLLLFRTHESDIDLVISDMVMPGLTGAQVYEALKEHGSAVPFLLSSGYQDRLDRTLGVPAGVRVIPKPWTIEDLAQTVRQALDRAH